VVRFDGVDERLSVSALLGSTNAFTSIVALVPRSVPDVRDDLHDRKCHPPMRGYASRLSRVNFACVHNAFGHKRRSRSGRDFLRLARTPR
jgi:hypothetical protein